MREPPSPWVFNIGTVITDGTSICRIERYATRSTDNSWYYWLEPLPTGTAYFAKKIDVETRFWKKDN